MINEHPYKAKLITDVAQNFLSFNSQGPSVGDGDDEIYIDCQPVGASDESKTVVTDTGETLSSSVNVISLFQNIFIQIVIGSIVFVLFIWIVSKFLDIAKVTRHASLKGGSWFYTTGAAS